LKLAKAQAHIGDDDESGPSGASNTPLADRKFFLDAQAEVINGGMHAVDSDELNFQKPTPLIGELKIEQPKMPWRS
jgi:DNA helicase INO80